MTITDDIKKLIADKLPGLHAEHLKDYIIESEKTLVNYKTLRQAYDKAELEIKDLNKKIGELVYLEALANGIKSDKEKILQEWKNLELDKLKFDISKQLKELQATEAGKRADSLYTLVGLLCRNPEAVKMFNTSETIMYSTQNEFNSGEGKYENKTRDRSAVSHGEEKIDIGKHEPPTPGNLD